MPSRILLLSPPFVPEYMRNARCDFVSLSATQWYPILLGYCGVYLQKLGHEVRLIDAPAHYLNHAETYQIVQDYEPDLIVLYTGFMSEKNDLVFTDRLVDDLGCDAVIVGPFASIDPEKTLSHAQVIDKLVVGEFEPAVGEIAAGFHAVQVKNLCYKENGQIVHNPRRSYLSGDQLDANPFVSRFFKQQLDLLRYKTPSELYPFMDIMSGRGCQWGRCSYCLWVHTYIKGSTYQVRSISNLVDEFDYIAKDLPQIKSVMIQDDTFTETRALEFSEAKIAAGIKLPWSCYARANMRSEVLDLMKRAGCRNLHVGFESADPQILRRIKKGITVAQMEQFARSAEKAGLRIHGDFAIGFPGETISGAQKTIEWACRLRPHTAQFQLMIPFPGTPYFEEMHANGWLNENGQPDMPQFTNEQIREVAKKAYRKFYFSPHYFYQCCRHPYELVFSRLKTYSRAIPAIFWRKWQV